MGSRLASGAQRFPEPRYVRNTTAQERTIHKIKDRLDRMGPTTYSVIRGQDNDSVVTFRIGTDKGAVVSIDTHGRVKKSVGFAGDLPPVDDQL